MSIEVGESGDTFLGYGACTAVAIALLNSCFAMRQYLKKRKRVVLKLILENLVGVVAYSFLAAYAFTFLFFLPLALVFIICNYITHIYNDIRMIDLFANFFGLHKMVKACKVGFGVMILSGVLCILFELTSLTIDEYDNKIPRLITLLVFFGDAVVLDYTINWRVFWIVYQNKKQFEGSVKTNKVRILFIMMSLSVTLSALAAMGLTTCSISSMPMGLKKFGCFILSPALVFQFTALNVFHIVIEELSNTVGKATTGNARTGNEKTLA